MYIYAHIGLLLVIVLFAPVYSWGNLIQYGRWVHDWQLSKMEWVARKIRQKTEGYYPLDNVKFGQFTS